MALEIEAIDGSNIDGKTVDNKLDRVLFIVLLCTVVFLPLLIFPQASDQVLSVKYLFMKTITVAGLGVIAAKYLLSSTTFSMHVNNRGFLMIIAAYLSVITLAAAVSPHLYASFEGAYLRYDGLFSHIIYVSIFFFATQCLNDKQRLEKLVKVGVLVGAIVSAYGISQVNGYDPIPWGHIAFDTSRSFSTFGNPVMLVAYLCLLLPLSIGLIIHQKSLQGKALYFSSMVAIAVCIGTSMTRAAWIAAFVGVALQVVLLYRGKRIRLRNFATIMIVIAIVVVVAVSFIGLDSLLSRIDSIIHPNQSITNRLVMWKSAFQIISDHPIVGIGPDLMAYVYPRYETVEMARTMPLEGTTNIHNIYLQLAIAAGIPALMAFLMIVVFLFNNARKYLSSLNKERIYNEMPIISGLIGGIVAYLIQGSTGISGIETSTFLWLFMGALAAHWTVEHSIKPLQVRKTVRGFAVVAVGIVVLFGATEATTVFASDYFLGKARMAENDTNIADAVNYYEKSLIYNPNDPKALCDLGILLADEGRTNGNEKEWFAGVQCLEEAVSKNKDNQISVQLLAQGYLYGARAFDKKYYKNAEDNLQLVLKLRPNAPMALAMLGVVYYDTGRIKQSGDSLRKAIYINPGDPQAHYYYGKYFEKIGQGNEARKQYAMTLEIDGSHEKARMAYEKLTTRGH